MVAGVQGKISGQKGPKSYLVYFDLDLPALRIPHIECIHLVVALGFEHLVPINSITLFSEDWKDNDTEARHGIYGRGIRYLTYSAIAINYISNPL